jgi:hypothetical protein
MSLWELLAPFLNGVFDDIQAVIVLGADLARRIEQKVTLVPAKVEHRSAVPFRVTELLLKIGKLPGLSTGMP